jgi:hypothetical protein
MRVVLNAKGLNTETFLIDDRYGILTMLLKTIHNK